MSKGIKGMVSCLVLGMIISGGSTVKADYFEHHKDSQPYCMQAKDITMSDRQRREWIEDGILEEKLIEKSEIFVREFRESNSKEPWVRYEGGYEVDAGRVEDIDFADGREQKNDEVVFYLQKEDNKEFFITVTVNVTAEGAYREAEEIIQDGSEEASEAAGSMTEGKITNRLPDDRTAGTPETDPVKTVEGSSENKETKEGVSTGYNSQSEIGGELLTMIPVINVSVAAAAFTGFSISLYSDYKVLFRYNRKLKKRRGEEK